MASLIHQTDWTASRELLYQRVLSADSIDIFKSRLSSFGCNRCTLSKSASRKVIYRGNPEADVALIGEAPGKIEDQTGLPFTGPAGELTDKIFKAIDLDTNTDMFISNMVMCRPAAPRGSGRENYTPVTSQVRLCKPYILRELELVNPKVIILCGLTAAVNLLGLGSKTRIKDVAGTSFTRTTPSQVSGKTLFIMYHPAAILHAQGEAKTKLRKLMWKHMQALKLILDNKL